MWVGGGGAVWFEPTRSLNWSTTEFIRTKPKLVNQTALKYVCIAS